MNLLAVFVVDVWLDAIVYQRALLLFRLNIPQFYDLGPLGHFLLDKGVELLGCAASGFLTVILQTL